MNHQSTYLTKMKKKHLTTKTTVKKKFIKFSDISQSMMSQKLTMR